MKINISIKPSRLKDSSISTWEVRDNRNKLVGTFDLKKDRDGKECGKLESICKVRNLANDLFEVSQSIKALIHKDNAWQIRDRAMKALSQTKDSIAELDLIIDHIKES